MSEYISIFSAPCYCLLRICFVGYGLSPFFSVNTISNTQAEYAQFKKKMLC